MVHLPSCQLHISVNRTAQIYLELHFCVELHTKKALVVTVYHLNCSCSQDVAGYLTSKNSVVLTLST